MSIVFLEFAKIENALFFLLVHAIGAFVGHMTRFVLQEPRPAMINHNIIDFTCSRTFGNPSDHDMLITRILSTIFFIFVHEKRIATVERIESRYL